MPMKIHEYQAKKILHQYQVAVPSGHVATTADQAERMASELGGKVVIKAQIHAGRSRQGRRRQTGC